jgi:hypothetical protein
LNPLVKNLGNFSAEVTKGLIGYSREKEGVKKVEELPAKENRLPKGDGYATKEGDILLGGFIQRHAAQEASRRGLKLSNLDVQTKEDLAYQVWQNHLQKFGDIGTEHYRHWLIRTKSFAQRRNINLPPRNSSETEHEYYRRLRKWVNQRPEKWPKLRKAVGTHLVFSPDPKVWPAIRGAGADERLFLRKVLNQTLKEFSDWRRKQVGKGHSLGWVAGTHVQANGADRHPHIHVVILKRDSAGLEVDWSVSFLKGRKEKDDPNPLSEVKKLFAKNVEKELGKVISKQAVAELEMDPLKNPEKAPSTLQSFTQKVSEHVRNLGKKLKPVSLAMRTYRPVLPGVFMGRRSEMGSILRLAALIQRNSRGKPSGIKSEVTLLEEKIRSLIQRSATKETSTPNLGVI